MKNKQKNLLSWEEVSMSIEKADSGHCKDLDKPIVMKITKNDKNKCQYCKNQEKYQLQRYFVCEICLGKYGEEKILKDFGYVK